MRVFGPSQPSPGDLENQLFLPEDNGSAPSVNWNHHHHQQVAPPAAVVSRHHASPVAPSAFSVDRILDLTHQKPIALDHFASAAAADLQATSGLDLQNYFPTQSASCELFLGGDKLSALRQHPYYKDWLQGSSKMTSTSGLSTSSSGSSPASAHISRLTNAMEH